MTANGQGKPVWDGDRPRRPDAALVALTVAAATAAALFVGTPSGRPAFVAATVGWGGAVAALAARGRLRLGHVLALTVLLRLVWLPLGPHLSDDVYRYLWDGVVGRMGLNPYAFRPNAIGPAPAPDLYAALNSAGYFSVYPPLSQAAFRVGALAYAHGGFEAGYYALKALFAAAELAALGLLARRVPPRAVVLYALLPLTVVEVAAQPHTEALALLLLGLAFEADRRGRPGLTGAALVGAGLVKLVPFVLVPFVLLRHRGRGAAWMALALAAGLAPFAAPGVLGQVRESLDLYVRLFEFNAGPYYALRAAVRALTGEDYGKLIGPAFRLAFGAAAAVLTVRAVRDRWSLPRAAVAVWGVFLALSTTVHPWYLLPVLYALAWDRRRFGPWHALALAAPGTYLRYTGGSYGAWVFAGWMAFALAAVWTTRRHWVSFVLRRRAEGKRRHLAPALPPDLAGLRVLDLGAGEGFVGEALARRGAVVTLADVGPAPGSALPYVRVPEDGPLPFAGGAFDAVVLVYVLHHARDPERLLAEAHRVSADRVVVLESVFRTEAERRWLRRLDVLANRLRGAGPMRAQEAHLAFRPAEAWRTSLERHGRTVTLRAFGRPPHRQALLHSCRYCNPQNLSK